MWARAYLGDDNRVAADRTNTTLMGSYGRQRMITNLADKVVISGIFLAPHFDDYELSVLRAAQIRYLVADQRFTAASPQDGYYYEAWEQLVVPYTAPLKPAMLGKFDTTTNVNRVFDSGDIRLYDVGTLAHESASH